MFFEALILRAQSAVLEVFAGLRHHLIRVMLARLADLGVVRMCQAAALGVGFPRFRLLALDCVGRVGVDCAHHSGKNLIVG